MNTIHVQKTRWLAWAAAALLLGAANIAQAGWVAPLPTAVDGDLTIGGITHTVAFTGQYNKTVNIAKFSTALTQIGAGNAPVSVEGYASNFLSYCVDLGEFANTNNNPSLAGHVQGNTSSDSAFNDTAGKTRNLGAGAWVINNFGSTYAPGTLFTKVLTAAEKYAAVQIAVWAKVYGLTIGNVTGNNATNVKYVADQIFAAAGNNLSTGFFVNFPPNGSTTQTIRNQDQMGAVPIPAALFFVAPALIGVLGGMRRKVIANQAMAA
jgi:hypothetical protein